MDTKLESVREEMRETSIGMTGMIVGEKEAKRSGAEEGESVGAG